MTSFSLRKGNPATTRADVVVIAAGQSATGALSAAPGGEQVASAYGRAWAGMLSAMDFTGKAGESLRVPTNGVIKAPTMVVLGVGRLDEVDADTIRAAAGVSARLLGNAATAAIALPSEGDLLGAVLDGLTSGAAKPGKPAVSTTEIVVLTDSARSAAAQRTLKESSVLAAAVARTRDWTNQPPNELNPVTFAKAAEEAAKGSGLKVTVYDDKQLAELGCGGILGVGAASATPPRLVKLEWNPKGAEGHLALVGKGITYDSGGLSIKPASSMKDMKFDMAGAAAVINAIIAIAELDLPIRVTAFAPMAENMVSGTAMRPGDVITMRDGRTVEVTNTDAEGRLILADALSLAVEGEPDAIANIATLTGAAVVALGDRYAALFGTREEVDTALAAAATVGELAWELPVPEKTRRQVQQDSQVADLQQHSPVRWGKSSFAAAFVQEFAGGLPFVHIDIAGPTWNSGSAYGHVPPGATGYGVRTLVQWVRSHITSP